MYLAIWPILLSRIICIRLSGKFCYLELCVSGYPANFTIRASLLLRFDRWHRWPFTHHSLLSFQILVISVITAIRYHDDLSVFDHHNDGVIETFQEVVNNDGSPSPYAEKEEEFDLATVSILTKESEDFPCETKSQSKVNLLAIHNYRVMFMLQGIAERQRSRYLRFARPPQEKHLIEARKTTLKQKKTGAVFSETLSFSILLFLLLVVAFGKDSQTPFQLNSTLETLLTKYVI